MTKRKPYRRPMTATWWLANPWFVRYILREATSLLVMLFSVQVFFALRAIATGAQAWADFVTWLTSPLAVALHILCLLAALIHTGSWFILAPKTMDLWFKHKKVADKLITTGHYLAFALVSLVLLVIIGGWL